MFRPRRERARETVAAVKGVIQFLGGGSRGSVTLLLFFILIAASSLQLSVLAAIVPPAEIVSRDSVSTEMERGIELTRLTQQFSARPKIHQRMQSLFKMYWRTDQRTPETEADRIRQDGRWYAGTEFLQSCVAQWWIASEGEHFDDRPTGSAAAQFRMLELQPNSPLLPEQALSFVRSSINSVRILRGGGGVMLRPIEKLSTYLGAGVVEDKRLGRVERGLGTWAQAKLDEWKAGGYLHSGQLGFNRETPTHHQNMDLNGRYSLFREFYPGNSNRASAAAALVTRDIYLDQSDVLSKREDRRIEVEDVLDYRINPRSSLQLAGDLLHDVTEQSQVEEARSRLEENQAGLRAQANNRLGKWSTHGQLGLRLITQTIREDVLQGSKADIALSALGPVGVLGDAAFRFAISKYQLDTKSDRNFDDRDELRFAAESALSRRINSAARLEVSLNTRLDHLVYLFRQKSANNRWTRYVGLSAKIIHQPARSFHQTVNVVVSANYTDYDFEQDARVTRSNVFRRLSAGDSLEVKLNSAWRLRARLQGQIEEFGRLFWDSFAEERSDETRSANTAFEIAHLVVRNTWVGAGGMWDSRRSVRFPTSISAQRDVVQDYQAYGPTWFVERIPARGLSARIHARHVRQFRLDKADRWLFIGEGALAWRF